MNDSHSETNTHSPMTNLMPGTSITAFALASAPIGETVVAGMALPTLVVIAIYTAIGLTSVALLGLFVLKTRHRVSESTLTMSIRTHLAIICVIALANVTLSVASWPDDTLFEAFVDVVSLPVIIAVGAIGISDRASKTAQDMVGRLRHGPNFGSDGPRK